MGIVSVPAEAAQNVVDCLVAAGIRAVLNFAPVRPRVPPGFRCKSVDLTVELESLSFFLSLQEPTEGDDSPPAAGAATEGPGG